MERFLLTAVCRLAAASAAIRLGRVGYPILRALALEVAKASSARDQSLEKIFGRPAPGLLTRFADFWLSKRNGRGMPSIADMDPLEMPWALAHIFVLARNEQGRFAYRIVGESMAVRLGGMVKGKTADQVFEPAYAETTEARWNKAADARMIYFNGSYHFTAGMIPVAAARLSMPLSSDGKSVDRLIGVAHFTELTLATDRDAAENFIHWTSVGDLPEEAAASA